MNLTNCTECGKIFVKTSVAICPDCRIKWEEQETLVAEYVRDNPKQSVKEICEATGVKEKIVYHMIKNGRFVGIAEIAYPCASCGTPITMGRYCDKCNENLLQQAQKTLSKVSQEQKQKAALAAKKRGMYTKDM